LIQLFNSRTMILSDEGPSSPGRERRGRVDGREGYFRIPFSL
jgi:hypothetical protein